MSLLPAEYIEEARLRAYRFQGAWTGTSGALAADTARLIKERQHLMSTIAELDQANAAMRAAIESRGCCDGGRCQPKPVVHAPPGYENFTLTPAEPLPAATFDEPMQVSGMPEEQLEAAWAAVKERHREMHARIREPADPPRDEQQAITPPGPAEGTTAKFGTGAVRSNSVEQFRYDLVSPIGLREVARTCAEGAQKYSDFNWERGMPVHDLLNHALAHIYQYLGGDRSEPHLGHAAWNVLAAIHSEELWPHLNQGTLRGPGCTPPT